MKHLHVWSVIALVFLADQLSKWIVLMALDLPVRGDFAVIPGLLNFALAWNTGVNFGLLSSGSALAPFGLVTLSVLVSAGLLWWIREGAHVGRSLGVALIVGGALGNALDRLVHGAVVDFINVSGFGIDNPYSFNIADIWVFLGAALILVSGEREPESRDRQEPAGGAR